MRRARILGVAATAAVLLVLGSEEVIGSPVEQCLLGEPDVTALTLPQCEERTEVDPSTTSTSVRLVPDPLPEAVPPLPPVPGRGCRAVDPGTPTCSFTATGWMEVDVAALGGFVDILDGDGERIGGFQGGGYGPSQAFGVVLPAEPGNEVVVRAEGGWVVARSRTR